MKNLSFRFKLFIVMTLLIIASDIIKVSFVANTSRERAVELAQDNLSVARSVFDSFIESWIYNNTRLTEAALKDFAIRAALTEDDTDTKSSVIQNVQQRLDMDWGVFLTKEGKIDTDPNQVLVEYNPTILTQLSEQAEESESHTKTTFIYIGEKLYLVLVSAVDPPAPRTLGYLVLGVELNTAFLSNLVAQMPKGIKATILIQSEKQINTAASLLDEKQKKKFADEISKLDSVPDFQILNLNDNESINGYLPLELPNADQKAKVFFHESLNEAVEKTKEVTASLIILFAISIILTIIAVVFLSRILSRPLQNLTTSIQGVREGDYSTISTTERTDEFGVLTNTFVEMVNSIQDREERLSYLARHDSTSGIANRLHFINTLETFLTKEPWDRLIVATVKLQSLSQIQQVFGQDISNKFIEEFSRRIQELSDEYVCIGHTRDNCFCIVFNDELTEATPKVITQISDLLKQAIEVEGDMIDAKECIGYVSTDRKVTDTVIAEDLLRASEAAIYRATKTQEHVIAYDKTLDAPQTEILSLLGEMYKGIEDGHFQLFLQPKIDIKKNRVVQAEALIRWFHPERGFIAPDLFIPLAEQTGRISHLTNWIIDEGIRHVQKLKLRNIDIKLGINLSVKDITDINLPNRLASKLKAADLSAEDFLLEITESGVIEDPETTLQVLNRLREMNIELAIDDFGTGQASLGYVQELPVNELKIDQAFVRHLASEEKDQAIVQASISLAHSLGLKVTAEGVEDKESVDILKKMKCDIIQGYYFAKPSNINEFIDFVEDFHSKTPVKKSKKKA